MPRTISLGGTELKISAAPLSAILYEDEFGRDLAADYAASDTSGNPSVVTLLRVVWAMAKTAGPDQVPSFRPWVASLPYGAPDMTDLVLRREVALEVEWGFFRSFRTAKDTLVERGAHSGEPQTQDQAGDEGWSANPEGTGNTMGGFELA